MCLARVCQLNPGYCSIVAPELDSNHTVHLKTGQVTGWLDLGQMMGHILCEGDSKVEPESAPV